VRRHALDLPRLALLGLGRLESPGWLRMIFDEEKVPYTLIMDEDVRRGGLRERFDVVLFPNTNDALKDIVGGIDPRHAPLAFTRTPQFPSHGSPTASADVSGGLTWRGIQNIEDFVRRGGLLLTLGGASTLSLDGGIARDVRRASTKTLSTPGSELRVRFRRPDHPIAYAKADVRLPRAGRSRGAARGRSHRSAMGTKIPSDDEPGKDATAEEKKEPLVVSGGVKGADEIEGKPAILDIPTGQGRVVAFDFDPIHRCLTLSDFRLVWNVLLNWNDLPPAPKGR
jgi:hypothetical protein